VNLRSETRILPKPTKMTQANNQTKQNTNKLSIQPRPWPPVLYDDRLVSIARPSYAPIAA